MLPGFRFLFAAIVLSMSLLVFGLGAAALLRAAHEEFASNPTWRAAPETVFAPSAETTRPVLALLRIDPPVTEKTPDNAPAAVTSDAASAALPFAPAEPERIAALKPEDAPLPETVKPETPAVESPQQNEATSAPADLPAPVAETKIAETTIAETQTAETTVAEAKTAETKTPDTNTPETKAATPDDISLATNEAAPPQAATATSPAPISGPLSPDADIAATKIATLGGPAVSIETPKPAKADSAKSDSAKSDSNVIKKRQQARRAARRRRLAELARLAPQAQFQQPASPFGVPAPASTIARRSASR